VRRKHKTEKGTIFTGGIINLNKPRNAPIVDKGGNKREDVGHTGEKKISGRIIRPEQKRRGIKGKRHPRREVYKSQTRERGVIM